MMKDVLRSIAQGKSLAEIAQDLDMEYSALMGMVEHLVKMGYLTTGERGDEDLAICKTCPLYRICSKKGPKIYYLTKKGEEAIK